ncbi:hypothetical protein CRE_32629 [Caenorhabditis remanei]|uniref:Uncharacterized protein n=1 Tax=Caenorhabditis remanei TaxID=31234 RepID=E3LRF4_CAERE|nr:hypothetical protein CRE_32629 [Caenorhabditis remanei]
MLLVQLNSIPDSPITLSEMDWRQPYPANSNLRNELMDGLQRDGGYYPSRPGPSAQEEFPPSESWWKETDPRQNWKPLKTDNERRENCRISRIESRNELQSNQEEMEPRNEDECLEIVVTSTKMYFSRCMKTMPGTIIDERTYFLKGDIPMIYFVNCSPERFDTLEKFCREALHIESSSCDQEICRDGTLIATKKKTVERIRDGQFQERTEYTYKFHKSANVTFYVAMHSDHA